MSIRVLFVVMLLTSIGLLPMKAADHKFVVIADPHIMAEELLVNDGTAFRSYLASTKKMTDFSKAIFDKAVSEIISMSPRPELVLIVGDLSKDGELVSHKYVRRKLDELKAKGISTLVIPGNHDWSKSGKRAKAVYFDGDSTFSAATCVRFGSGNDSLEEIYGDYGFRRCYMDSATVSVLVERESEASTLTYACEPIPGLVIIGIDSGNNGVLSETTVDWVCGKAEAASKNGKQVIAMMHYPLIAGKSTGGSIYYPSKEEDPEKNGHRIVRNRLVDAGINLILTGHSHYHGISKDWNADKSRTIFDIITGSLSWYPCYYRVVTFSENFNEVWVTSSCIKEADNSLLGNPFSREVAKAQFAEENYIQSLKDDLVSAGLNADTALIAAPYLATAYMYHSEGDETKNPAVPSLLMTLSSLFINSPLYLSTVNCMLLDISNYGDPERENQTDDCNLIIRFDGATSLHSAYIDGCKDSDTWHTLDGFRLINKPTRKGVYIKNGKKYVISN